MSPGVWWECKTVDRFFLVTEPHSNVHGGLAPRAREVICEIEIHKVFVILVEVRSPSTHTRLAKYIERLTCGKHRAPPSERLPCSVPPARALKYHSVMLGSV
jgi:hypothetical protein